MQTPRHSLRVLFLCTGNSCRSQMAEGWTRHLKGETIEAHSAGVDISAQRSKHVDQVRDVPFDYVVTLCDDAREQCPLFPGRTKLVHVGFEDPAVLAADAGTKEEALAHYRRVRDEIREFVQKLPQALTKPAGKRLK